jgi:hypothetical protein
MQEYEEYFEEAVIDARRFFPNLILSLRTTSPQFLYELAGTSKWYQIRGTALEKFFNAYHRYYKGIQE